MGNKITPESVAASPNSAKRDDLLAKEAGLDDYAEEQERSLEELPDQVIILNTPPLKRTVFRRRRSIRLRKKQTR
jgi:hypothetical protein